jgi:cobalamin biosynthesis protein CobT
MTWIILLQERRLTLPSVVTPLHKKKRKPPIALGLPISNRTSPAKKITRFTVPLPQEKILEKEDRNRSTSDSSSSSNSNSSVDSSSSSDSNSSSSDSSSSISDSSSSSSDSSSSSSDSSSSSSDSGKSSSSDNGQVANNVPLICVNERPESRSYKSWSKVPVFTSSFGNVYLDEKVRHKMQKDECTEFMSSQYYHIQAQK